MGVDYLLVEYNNIITNENYLKNAWRDIRWKLVFTLLNINLDLLYGCPILNYWSTECVENIYNLLVKLYENPSDILFDEVDVENALYLKDDILKLKDLFKIYVDNKCIIKVF
jgi:hypothetical protein